MKNKLDFLLNQVNIGTYNKCETIEIIGFNIFSLNHNIIIERFFRTLKQNNIYISDYQTIKDLKEGIKAFMYKYNFKRFHLSLNYQKPMNIYLDFIQKTA